MPAKPKKKIARPPRGGAKRAIGGNPTQRGGQPPTRPIGGQPANANALVHGFYSNKFNEEEMALIVQFCVDPTLDDEIIMQRVANARLIDSMTQTQDDEIRVRMFEALSTGLGRVAKLLRDKRALSGEAANGIADAIAAALDELATETGIAL